MSRTQAIGDLRGWAPPAALEIEYSLIERLAIAEVVKEVAAELGRTPAQVGLAWILRNRE
ncbi:aryl-alcohol dehydrogenase-like predicted oxidoreductase [Streptomyces sp. DSM 40167]|nr:aryl-alcohol dehydrogenase-like predicted oxidoreductase [Streptomyces sp. DSM 40167]